MLTTNSDFEILVDFFRNGRLISYDKGEFVVRPGSDRPGVFYVESGLVKAYDITKYGEENLLIIRKAGDILGLTWAITGENRHIIYEALQPSTAWQVSRENFLDFVKTNPAAALPLVDMLTDMYRLHSLRILNLEYRTVRERLISFLLGMAQRFGKPSAEGLVISVPLRHQDIASSINSTRETTSREIAHLERKGLLYNEQLIITLKDTEKLRRYLEDVD
jgi:CRP/FNR family transcriptional regulator